jgi:glycine/D-amino acid oxidase-like deaminating enzyme
MRHGSYWERTLQPAPQATGLPARTDVLIVGAGFMGCWLALFLGRLKSAPSILVVERDLIGYGASTRNAGFLTCGNISEMLEDSRALGFEAVMQMFERRRRGIAIVRAEFPELALDECGSADFDNLDAEKIEFAQRVNSSAGQAVFVPASATLGGREQRVLRNAGDAGVHPGELLAMLRARSTGPTFAHGVAIRDIGNGTARWTAGEATGETKYDRAFVCTNAFARELDRAGDVIPGRGQVIITSPVQTRASRTLGYMNNGYDYFRFVDDRLLIGGGRDRFRAAEETASLETTAPVMQYLREAAARVLGHATFSVDYQWAGIMGFKGGNHLGGPPVRRMDARTTAVAGFGGMGVALTPVTAQEVLLA